MPSPADPFPCNASSNQKSNSHPRPRDDPTRVDTTAQSASGFPDHASPQTASHLNPSTHPAIAAAARPSFPPDSTQTTLAPPATAMAPLDAPSAKTRSPTRYSSMAAPPLSSKPQTPAN